MSSKRRRARSMGIASPPPAAPMARKGDDLPRGVFIEVKPSREPVKLATPPEVYAEAVHRAVCEFTGTDGFGHCYFYTLAGYGLLILTGHARPYTQAGALYLQPNPDDPEFWHVLDPEDAAGLDRGEFHSWIALETGVFVDFSSRHYARFSREMITHSGIIDQAADHVLYALDDAAKVPWNRPEPPVVLWGSPHTFPGWVRLGVNPAACTALVARVQQTTEDVLKPLVRLARRHFQELGGVAESH